MSGAAANAATRAALRALTTTAAAAAANDVAGCRSAEAITSPSSSIVYDGTSSWQLLNENDIAEASELMAGAGEVSAKALEVATKMAQRSEVQRAFAEELGISPVREEKKVIEDEVASLNRMIDSIQQENDSLRASAAAARAALSEQQRTQERAFEDDCIRLENSLVLVDHTNEIFENDESRLHEEDEVKEDETIIEEVEDDNPIAEEDEEAIEDEQVEEDQSSAPDTSGDEILAQKIADEEIRRLEGLRRQEFADELFAKHLSEQYDQKAPAQSSPTQSHTSKDKTSKSVAEEDDANVLEYALALVGIILAFALTRKFSPTLGKKAFLLGTAAVAAVSAKFHRV